MEVTAIFTPTNSIIDVLVDEDTTSQFIKELVSSAQNIPVRNLLVIYNDESIYGSQLILPIIEGDPQPVLEVRESIISYQDVLRRIGGLATVDRERDALGDFGNELDRVRPVTINYQDILGGMNQENYYIPVYANLTLFGMGHSGRVSYPIDPNAPLSELIDRLRRDYHTNNIRLIGGREELDPQHSFNYYNLNQLGTINVILGL